jgi:hypothetical protein
MLLKVPTIEAKNRCGCGPTCVSMVLKYYRKDYLEQQVIDKLKIGIIEKDDIGTKVIDHAQFAKKLGFDVICYSYNMELYKPNFSKLPPSKLIRELKRLLRKRYSSLNRTILETTIELLKEGADFKIKMPEIKDIISFLKKRIPVILAVNAKILFETDRLPEFPKIPNNMGHFIVITGFIGNKFYYNDPYFGESKEISKDKLFFALSNNILDSSAYLLVLK